MWRQQSFVLPKILSEGKDLSQFIGIKDEVYVVVEFQVEQFDLQRFSDVIVEWNGFVSHTSQQCLPYIPEVNLSFITDGAGFWIYFTHVPMDE